MELPSATVNLLRDEAYVHLCREAVQEKLDALEQEKAAVASTRPPFGGVLTRKQTRDAFTRSMRTVLEGETALRDRLAQVVRLEGWLQPLIRGDLTVYMESVSADYQRFSKMQQLLDDWERGLIALPDLLAGFSRDMRAVREASARASNLNRDCAQELAALRLIAIRAEELHIKLVRSGLELATHAKAVGADDLRLPTLPDLQRVQWVTRLGVMPLGQVANELLRFESELRASIADGCNSARIRLQVGRERCTELQEAFLQSYWNQLRTHACIHYVQERDIDEVLATLGARYAGAMRIERQQALATHDPFFTAR